MINQNKMDDIIIKLTTDDEKFILCVDDEINVLHSLKRLLSREGYCVSIAISAEEGLAVLAQNDSFHAVISDQRMPGMCGSQFLKLVKEKYPDMIRLILSGYADLPSIVEAINESEVFYFLAKPWNDVELKSVIRLSFERYDLGQQNRLHIQKLEEQNIELKLLNQNLTKNVDSLTSLLRCL